MLHGFIIHECMSYHRMCYVKVWYLADTCIQGDLHGHPAAAGKQTRVVCLKHGDRHTIHYEYERSGTLGGP